MPVLYREHRTSWARTSSPSAADNVINCPCSFSSVWTSFSSLYPTLCQSQSTSVGVRRGESKSSCLLEQRFQGALWAKGDLGVTPCTPLPGESQAHLCGEIEYYWWNLVPALKGYKCEWKRLWQLLGEMKSNFTRAWTLCTPSVCPLWLNYSFISSTHGKLSSIYIRIISVYVQKYDCWISGW